MAKMKPPAVPKMPREGVLQLAKHPNFLRLFEGGKLPPVFVVAYRAYYLNSMGRRGKNDRGIYDDAFFILDQNGFFASFNGNTDPSIYRAGRAMLEAPQVVKYRAGYHGYNSRYGHPAFRQASDVVVVRDGGQGNGKALGNGRFTDKGGARFWINNHKGGWSTTSSAGCLTVPPDQWDAYYSTLRMLMKRNGVQDFQLLLVENA